MPDLSSEEDALLKFGSNLLEEPVIGAIQSLAAEFNRREPEFTRFLREVDEDLISLTKD